MDGYGLVTKQIESACQRHCTKHSFYKRRFIKAKEECFSYQDEWVYANEGFKDPAL